MVTTRDDLKDRLVPCRRNHVLTPRAFGLPGNGRRREDAAQDDGAREVRHDGRRARGGTAPEAGRGAHRHRGAIVATLRARVLPAGGRANAAAT